MKPITSVASFKDPYIKRILSNIVGKDAMNIFCRTPSRLNQLLKGLSVRELSTPEKKGKWSITQIVAHLCDSELVMGFRFRMAIAQPKSQLQAFDQDKWARRLRYASADCRKKL